MYIFLSYSRADLADAEQIVANLKQAGHKVFFDKHSIKAAEDFNRVIWNKIQKADLFLFLISENSVRQGSYALTELTLAEKKWPNPERKVLPVLIKPMDLANVPIYASICNILQPEGNVAARVTIEVNHLKKVYLRKKIAWSVIILTMLTFIGWGGVFVYQEYIAQTPEKSRTALGAMNVAYNSETFLDSALRGDLGVVKLFLSAGMNSNATNKSGNTALMQAIIGDHINVVEILCQSGADVNKANKNDVTALSLAIDSGQDAMLSLLLNAGARVDKVAFANVAANGDVSMLTKLMTVSSKLEQSIVDEGFISAVEHGQHEVLALLIDKLSDQSKVVSTALIRVSTGELKNNYGRSRGLVEVTKIFKYLLDHGANVNIRDKEGCPALIYTAIYARSDLAKMLLDKNADPNAVCDNSAGARGGLTVLTEIIDRSSSIQQKRDFMDQLFISGVDVNQSRRDGETALMLAAGKSLEIVQILLEKGAKVNDRSEKGKTAVRSAIQFGSVAVLTALLDKGGIIDPEDNLLIYAVDQKKYSIVQKLLQQGVDINQADSKGSTALIHAVQWGDVDMVRLLIDAGANISIKDEMGRTAEVFAKRGKQISEMIKLLGAAVE